MPGLSQDPILTIRDLLVNNWIAANTSNITPKIHTGWWNRSWAVPQITVQDRGEVPSGGGTTGFSSMNSSTGSGEKQMNGDISVVAWCHDQDGSGINPLILRFEMSEEVKRIVKANTFPGNDLDWLSWVSRSKLVDDAAEPILFRYDMTLRYRYRDRV